MIVFYFGIDNLRKLATITKVLKANSPKPTSVKILLYLAFFSFDSNFSTSSLLLLFFPWASPQFCLRF